MSNKPSGGLAPTVLLWTRRASVGAVTSGGGAAPAPAPAVAVAVVVVAAAAAGEVPYDLSLDVAPPRGWIPVGLLPLLLLVHAAKSRAHAAQRRNGRGGRASRLRVGLCRVTARE